MKPLMVDENSRGRTQEQPGGKWQGGEERKATSAHGQVRLVRLWSMACVLKGATGCAFEREDKPSCRKGVICVKPQSERVANPNQKRHSVEKPNQW